MPARLLDGQHIRDQLFEELQPRIARLRAAHRAPGLAVVLAGDHPASQIYVRNKIKACETLGMRSFRHCLPPTVSTAELLSLVSALNQDPAVDGILVQMPLPSSVDARAVLHAVNPDKDADGFHPVNAGKLMENAPGPRPCTPAGVMEILRRSDIEVAGRKAVVVGRSDIVGKPMALLLLHAHATVTICHSRTPDLAAECRQADILVAAMGRPEALGAEHIRPGAVVIDVGINRVKGRVTGDVNPQAARERASAFTPVPGGVGPLTIAMLMANTVSLAERHLGLAECCW